MRVVQSQEETGGATYLSFEVCWGALFAGAVLAFVEIAGFVEACLGLDLVCCNSTLVEVGVVVLADVFGFFFLVEDLLVLDVLGVGCCFDVDCWDFSERWGETNIPWDCLDGVR